MKARERGQEPAAAATASSAPEAPAQPPAQPLKKAASFVDVVPLPA